MWVGVGADRVLWAFYMRRFVLHLETECPAADAATGEKRADSSLWLHPVVFSVARWQNDRAIAFLVWMGDVEVGHDSAIVGHQGLRTRGIHVELR